MTFNDVKSIEEVCGIKGYLHNQKLNCHLELFKNPDNFKVFEILPDKTTLIPDNFTKFNQLKGNGLFYHAILSKRKLDTPQATRILTKALNIPNDYISYAGLKDADAETHQRISIFYYKKKSENKLEFKKFKVHSFLRQKYEINPGDLYGNYFKITLHASENTNLNDFKDDFEEKINSISKYGFPNYFGLQRFGSTRPISHIVGKFILLGKYKEAFELYLTKYSKYENENISSLRLELKETNNLRKYFVSLPKHYQYEIRLAKSLLKYPTNYEKALNTFPNEIKRLFVHSYQSYIFNRMISELLTITKVKQDLTGKIPLINFNTDFNGLEKEIKGMLYGLLSKDEVKIKNFKNPKHKWFQNKKLERNILEKPEKLSYHLENSKMNLKFILKKATYATMLIREFLRAI